MKKILVLIFVFSSLFSCGQPLIRSVFKATKYVATDTIKSYSINGNLNVIKHIVAPNIPNDTIQTLSGTTVVWDCSRGVHGIITLSGNTTITLSNVTKAFSGNLTVINPSGAAYTLTFAGYTNKISPAIYAAANQVTCSGDSKIDVFSWWYDGTRLFWNGTNGYE